MMLFPVSDTVGLKIPENRKLIRERIMKLENLMLQLPQVEMALRHVLADGLYAREMTILKGVLLTGKIHKREHINFITKGDISVLTEWGMQRIKAPTLIKSPPGTKRVLFAHEETIWTTVHATTETDIERIEQDVATMSYDDVKITEDIEFLEIKGDACLWE